MMSTSFLGFYSTRSAKGSGGLRLALIVLGVLFLVELAVAFSPLTEGEEGTAANMVGDVVWTAMPTTLVALIAVGIIWIVKRNKKA